MSLTTTRDALAACLATALDDASITATVHTETPDVIEGPTVVIAPGDGYLTAAETFDTDEYWLTLDVHLIVELVSNDQCVTDLENVLTVILPAIVTPADDGEPDWDITAINKPEPVTAKEWLAYGQRLTVRTLITIT